VTPKSETKLAEVGTLCECHRLSLFTHLVARLMRSHQEMQ